MTFSSLVTKFLQGSGIPCPNLFEDAKQHFSPIINIGNINKPSFRPRMFCWAMSGSSEKASDANRIEVSKMQNIDIPVVLTNLFPFQLKFVEDDDPNYGKPENKTAMAAEGKIDIKTCISKGLAPASYLIRLAGQQYTASGPELRSFFDAFDHWLLCEILNAIGNHTTY